MNISFKIYIGDNLADGAQIGLNESLYESRWWKMYEWYHEILEGKIKARDAKLILVFDDERAVGAILIAKHLAGWIERNDNVKFVSCFINPAYRKNGLMKRAFEFGTRREINKNYYSGGGIEGSSDFFKKLGIKSVHGYY